MMSFFKKAFPPGSTRRFFVSILRRSPFSFFGSVVASVIATYKLTGKIAPIKCIVFPGIQLRVRRHPESTVSISGRLVFHPHADMVGCSSISLGKNASLSINGDFEIGQGVSLSMSGGGKLNIGGKRLSSGSGITKDTIVMVEESLSIGCDVIVAWGCTITDSDWHDIEGQVRCKPVVIGDHVWVGHQVSVLKGAVIPSGCIVGARSVVGSSDFPENALIAGAPAVIVKTGIAWKR